MLRRVVLFHFLLQLSFFVSYHLSIPKALRRRSFHLPGEDSVERQASENSEEKLERDEN